MKRYSEILKLHDYVSLSLNFSWRRNMERTNYCWKRSRTI